MYVLQAKGLVVHLTAKVVLVMAPLPPGICMAVGGQGGAERETANSSCSIPLKKYPLWMSIHRIGKILRK